MRIDIFIILLIAAILLYRWYQKIPKSNAGDDGRSSTEMVMDPNCEIYIPQTEAIRATIGDRDHFFCSEKCAAEYRKWHSTV